MSVERKEIWKPIENYEGMYEISSLGRVKSYKRNEEKILVPRPNRGGYHLVHFRKDGKDKGHQIHRLVAKAFIPNPENKREVNHIDGDKTNNKASNLEWVTPKENSRHAWETGLQHHSRLCRHREVQQIELGTGRVIATYYSTCEAARAVNGHHGCIVLCCQGKQNKSKGYVWKYAE